MIGVAILIALLVLIGLYLLTVILAPFYFKFGWFKCFYHNFMEWHQPVDELESFDGSSLHSTCKHCGKAIMMDSQGNWF